MLALLAASLLPPGPVTLPDYAPGDAYVFSDGRVERVVAAKGDQMTWSGLTGASYQRSRNFIVPVLQWRSGRGTGTRKVRGNPTGLWPLGHSKSARFRVITQVRSDPQAASRRSVSLWVCTARKVKNVTVPAGTYGVIPVVCDRYSPTTMRLIERRKWDYAPAVGHYIRRVNLNYLRGTTRSVELFAALSGPAASLARLRALSQQARAAESALRKR